jgi:hypothetical protein
MRPTAITGCKRLSSVMSKFDFAKLLLHREHYAPFRQGSFL